jgi:hypothetical protein
LWSVTGKCLKVLEGRSRPYWTSNDGLGHDLNFGDIYVHICTYIYIHMFFFKIYIHMCIYIYTHYISKAAYKTLPWGYNQHWDHVGYITKIEPLKQVWLMDNHNM